MKSRRNTVKIIKSKPYGNKVYPEKSGSKTSSKNITKAQPYKYILPDTKFYPNKPKGDYIGTQKELVGSRFYHSSLTYEQ